MGQHQAVEEQHAYETGVEGEQCEGDDDDDDASVGCSVGVVVAEAQGPIHV